MRQSPLTLVASLLVVVASVASPLPARALECLGFGDEHDARELRSATLVFSGTVAASGVEQFGVTFVVDRVWKGSAHRTATLYLFPNLEGPSVEFFRPGERYLVLTHSAVDVLEKADVTNTRLPAGTLGVWLGCGDAARLAEAARSVARLGQGHPPQ